MDTPKETTIFVYFQNMRVHISIGMAAFMDDFVLYATTELLIDVFK